MLARATATTVDTPVSQVSLDFETIYAQQFDFVWRNLRRLGVPESCLRDAAQEVFLVVYRRIGEFTPIGTVRSWIYSILRRVALHQKRKERGRFPSATTNADKVADTRCPSPEADVAHGQALRVLLQ